MHVHTANSRLGLQHNCKREPAYLAGKLMHIYQLYASGVFHQIYTNILLRIIHITKIIIVTKQLKYNVKYLVSIATNAIQSFMAYVWKAVGNIRANVACEINRTYVLVCFFQFPFYRFPDTSTILYLPS